jgi:hypothetical protein
MQSAYSEYEQQKANFPESEFCEFTDNVCAASSSFSLQRMRGASDRAVNANIVAVVYTYKPFWNTPRTSSHNFTFTANALDAARASTHVCYSR